MIIALERGFSTYTNVAKPDTNYYGSDSLYAHLNDKAIYIFTPVTTAKGGVIPLDDNVLVAQAKLNLYVAANLPANTTVTIKRITEDWDYNAVAYNTEPAVTETNKAELLTSASAGTYIEIDIKDMIQDVVDNREASGYVWFGFEITVDKSSDCIFASWLNSTPAIRPYIKLKYSVPPQQPVDLRPNGTIIGSLTPVLSCSFFEDDPEDYCSKLQIQLHDSNDFSAPDYDSGTVVTNKSSYMIEPAPVLVTNTDYWWRIRVGDSYGVWSPWSDPATFKQLTLPTVAITAPASANTRIPVNHDFIDGVEGGWTLDTQDVNVLSVNQADVETDTTGFTLDGSTISRSATEFRFGEYSLKTITDNAAADEGWRLSASIVVNPSVDHTASVEVIGVGTVYLEIEERNAADALLGTTQQALTVDVNEWKRVEVTRSFGATGVKCRVNVVTQSQQASTFYCDMLQLEEASLMTGWHLPGSAATKESLEGEELDTLTCGVTIYNGISGLTDIHLYKDSVGDVTSGDILVLRVRLRCTLDAPTLRFRVIRAEAPWTEYISESEELTIAGEYYEFEYQYTIGETVPIRVMLDMGGLANNSIHGVEIDYLSVNRVTFSRLPEITHTFTPGGNGDQVYVTRELWWLNTVTDMWEQVGLHSLTPSTDLTYQTGLGVVALDGDYKLVVKAQDGDLPREAIENSPVYGEDELQFEVRIDDDGEEIEDTGELAIVYYEEHYDVDFVVWFGAWNDIEDDTNAHNGDYKDTDESGAYVLFSFQGNTIAWIGSKNSDMGIAEVFIDGVSMGTVDCYAAAPAWQENLFEQASLSEENSVGELVDHTIKIVNTGTKNGSSSAYFIDLDAWVVTGHNIPFPTGFEEEIEMDLLDDDAYDFYRDGDEI